MSGFYVLTVEGLADLKNGVADMDDKIMKAARMALNKTADRARVAAAREIGSDLNFKASYITGSGGKLQVTTKATDDSLEAAITGSFRPTSLARFAKNTDPKRAKKTGSVGVEVSRGLVKFLPKAFFVKLRSGADGSTNNTGLAMRLKPGDVLKNKKYNLQKLAGNVYLLYGPSVQQAFINRQGGGAAEKVTPEMLDFLEREFLRLTELELK